MVDVISSSDTKALVAKKLNAPPGTPTNGQVPTADSTSTTGVSWKTPAVGGAAAPADATTTTNGVVRLAGDLGGTAASPTLKQVNAATATYGSSMKVPQVTVDTAGRVTSVVEAAIAQYTDEQAQDAAAALLAAGTHSGVTVTYDDVNNRLSLALGGANLDSIIAALVNSSTSATRAAVAAVGGTGGSTLANTAAPTVTGNAVVGGTLTAGNGSWNPTPDTYTWQWLRAGVQVAGATSQTYALTSADAGQQVSVRVGAAKAGYQAGSATSSAVTVTGASTIPGQDVEFASGGSTAQSASATIPQATHVFVVPANTTAFANYVSSSADGGVRIYGTSDNRVQVYVQGGGYLTQCNASIDFTRPNIIVVTYDATTGFLMTYLNGVPIGTDRRGGGFSFTGSGTVVVGSFLSAYKRFSRALYGREVRQLFAQLSSQYGIALTAGVASTTTTPLTVTGVKGTNQHPKNANFSGGLGVFEQFWGAQWDLSWVQDSVDKAKARGANVFRIIGDVQGIKAGTIAQADYTSRLKSVADYVAGKGMRLYYCGCDLNQRGNAVQADIVAQYVEVAKVLQTHAANVYGFDLANEIRSTYGSTPKSTSFPWMQAASNAVRQVAPNVPLSVSDIGGGGSDDGGSAGGVVSRAACIGEYKAWAPYVDFFDIHAYEDVSGELAAWQLAPYEASVSRPLSIGEFGTNIDSAGDAAGAALFGRVKAMRDNSTAVVAVTQWAIRNDQYGLYKEYDGSIRTQTAAAFDAI